MTAVTITKIPTDYYSWVECLKLLQTGIPDRSTIMMINKGYCSEYAGIKGSMHKLIEETVNALIANCIKELKRDISKFADLNETDGFHLAFQRFEKRISSCMFFMGMGFLDENFRKELCRETIKQINLFWSEMINQIKKDTAARDNARMAEELFLIKRIRLLKDYQISE